MALSQQAVQGLLASATDVVYLECLTITHPNLPEGPIRLVNDRASVTRTAGLFMAFPFTVVPPAQDDDRAPTLEITADMVDQRIMVGLRGLVGDRTRATVTYEVITAGAPNTVEWGPVEFSLDTISTDGAATIKLRASFSMGLLNDAFPRQVFSPGNRSGL